MHSQRHKLIASPVRVARPSPKPHRVLQGMAWLMGLVLLLVVSASQADIKVNSVRTSSDAQKTRVVFDLSSKATHSLFTLEKPNRVVVDIPGTRLDTGLKNKAKGVLAGIRSGVRNKKDLRLVLDLKKSAVPRSFLLKPDKKNKHYRLVIDLESRKASKPVKSVTSKAKSQGKPRDVIIAVDAGHGGKDPGAHGGKGLREKDAMLQLAKKLVVKINAQPGMRAVLTRKGDYFLTLRQRIKLARKHKADMFVSLHADAFRDPRARGSSVYVLSNRGATSEAGKWLAAKENAADLVGGVSLDDKEDQVAKVLLDLSQEATIDASIKGASRVLRELKTVGKVHRKHVERAGFVVLKSPDIPSMLIETAFISNPTEERRLKTRDYQNKLAAAITRGVRNYFKHYAPPGTQLALQNDRVVAQN